MHDLPKILSAKPLDNYMIEVEFESREKRIFDIKKYCTSNYFKELLDLSYFCRLTVRNGTISWPNDQDIAPETIYLDSIEIK